jgi:ubiquinone/menaquinone biosynthesis C-methylase UbiE
VAPNPSAAWKAGHPWASVYDFFVERESLARVAGRLAFGTDTRLLYDAIGSVGELPEGSAVLDIPTGGGVALRGLRPGQGIRYVAADISPEMLGRAERAARERGVEDQVELRAADVEALPFADGEFDLCLSFAGLHCFPDPRAAVVEIARVVRPGGRFTGSVFLTGTGPRYAPAIVGGRVAGLMGPSGTRADLEEWLHEAGFRQVRIELSGAIGYFSATMPDAPRR